MMSNALILGALLSFGGVEASGHEDVRLLAEIESVRHELERAVHRSCSSDLADKAEDVLEKLETTGRKLDASSPDEQAAAGASKALSAILRHWSRRTVSPSQRVWG